MSQVVKAQDSLVKIIENAFNGDTIELKKIIAEYIKERERIVLIAEKKASELDSRITLFNDILNQVEEGHELDRKEMD